MVKQGLPVEKKSWVYRDYGLVLLSSFFLVLSYPYFPTWFFVFIAFVPLYFLSDDHSLGYYSRLGFIHGFVFHFFAFNWIVDTIVNYSNLNEYLAYTALLLFSIISSVMNMLFFVAVRWLSRNGALSPYYGFPLVYTVLDFLYPQIFPFYLGLSVYTQPLLIQVIDITGITGLSFFLVLNNSVIAVLIRTRRLERNRVVAFGGIWLFVLCYGAYNLWLKESKETASLRYSVVQANILIEDRFGGGSGAEIFNRLIEGTIAAAKDDPDLIIWTEAVYPFVFREKRNDVKILKQHIRELGKEVLVGMVESREKKSFNAVTLIDGKGKLVEKYRKMLLLVFGEYLPFEDYFPILSEWIRGGGHFKAGETYTVFQLKNGQRFSTPICYEMIKPLMVRRFVGGGADFLINLTNDVWFGDTKCPYQHFGLCVFRAVENRVPLIRAANTGISAAVDQNGRILDQTGLFEPTILRGEVVHRSEFSFYREFGPLVEIAAVITLLLFFVRGWIRLKRSV